MTKYYERNVPNVGTDCMSALIRFGQDSIELSGLVAIVNIFLPFDHSL